VICLQEIFNTKYFPADDRKDVAHLAETIPGKTTSILSDLARKLGAELSLYMVNPLAQRNGRLL
jgi:predicted amidohydrolase